MTNPPNIDAIIAELSEATGPSRELDAQIWLAVTPGATRRLFEVPANETRRGWTIDETREASGRLIIVPAFTASLDAAMALVPERWLLRQVYFDRPCADDRKWNVQLHGGREGEDCFTAFAATRVLALCAAALRSRAALRVRSALIGEVGRDG